MNRQELAEKFNEQLKIEDYSIQTIRNYSSAINLFLEYIKKIKQVTNTYQETDTSLQS